jgi:hypothetical protein
MFTAQTRVRRVNCSTFSPPERRMQIAVIWDQHAEENIWTQEKQRNKEKEEITMS